MRTLLTLLTAVLLTSACRTDGANGENGKVRFSMVFNAQEVSDFTPPMALGSSLLIQLEEPESLTTGLAQPGFPELTLEVKAVGHGGSAKVLPLGFAQYAIQPDSEGDYQLVAKNGSTVLDALSLKVAKPDHLRPAPTAYTVRSVQRSGGVGSCTVSVSGPWKDVVLHKNDRVSYSLMAADKDDKPMLGLLGLAAKSEGELLELDTTWLLEGSQPNALVVRPKATLSDKAIIKITEASGLTLDLELKTDETPATGTCN